MSDITLPSLLCVSSKSQFRLRVHAIAWSDDFGSAARFGSGNPGVVMLSCTGADTAVKAARSLLYMPDVECGFTLELESPIHLSRAQYESKPVAYQCAVSKLAPGAIHLVGIAKVPGLLVNMDDDHLWQELNGERYTTPLLRSWVGWLKRRMMEEGLIVMAEGIGCNVGVLTADSAKLDNIVSDGVREGYLKMVA